MKMRDFCDFRSGLWNGKKEPFAMADVYTMKNFSKDCELNAKEAIVLEVEEKSLQSRVLLNGDLLLEKSGGGKDQAVGRVILFDKENDKRLASFGNFTARIRIKDKNVAEPSFLHQYLKHFYMQGGTKKFQHNTTGIRNLKMSQYVDISILIPPIKEQRHISALLKKQMTEIEAMRLAAQESVSVAQAMPAALLRQIFGEPS